MEHAYLRDMMSSYFHQDYDLTGLDDAAILRSYAMHRGRDAVMATVREIEAMLGNPTEGLLVRFERATGRGNMMIGETDGEARIWLEESAARLEGHIGDGG